MSSDVMANQPDEALDNRARHARAEVERCLRSLPAGVDAQLRTRHGLTHRLVHRHGSWGTASSSEMDHVAVQAVSDGRHARFATELLGPADLGHAVARARELASQAPDVGARLPEPPDGTLTQRREFRFDRGLAQWSMVDLGAVGTDAIRQISSRGISIECIELQVTSMSELLYSSRGVRQEAAVTQFSWQIVAANNGGAAAAEEASGCAYSARDALERLPASARRLDSRLSGSWELVPAPSYDGVVTLAPRAVRDLVVAFVMVQLDGNQVRSGRSRWGPRRGERVASPGITIVDDPFDGRLRGACTYDSEGHPVARRQLVRDGVLIQGMVDCTTARALGLPPNGTAGGPFGMSVGAGDLGDDSLLDGLDQAVLVERFCGDANFITGDFSGIVKRGELLRGGERASRLREFHVRGNLFEIINSVERISSSRVVVGADAICPAMLVDGVFVRGC